MEYICPNCKKKQNKVIETEVLNIDRIIGGRNMRILKVEKECDYIALHCPNCQKRLSEKIETKIYKRLGMLK